MHDSTQPTHTNPYKPFTNLPQIFLVFYQFNLALEF
jgi:hypothetical protein